MGLDACWLFSDSLSATSDSASRTSGDSEAISDARSARSASAFRSSDDFSICLPDASPFLPVSFAFLRSGDSESRASSARTSASVSGRPVFVSELSSARRSRSSSALRTSSGRSMPRAARARSAAVGRAPVAWMPLRPAAGSTSAIATTASTAVTAFCRIAGTGGYNCAQSTALTRSAAAATWKSTQSLRVSRAANQLALRSSPPSAAAASSPAAVASVMARSRRETYR